MTGITCKSPCPHLPSKVFKERPRVVPRYFTARTELTSAQNESVSEIARLSGNALPLPLTLARARNLSRVPFRFVSVCDQNCRQSPT